VDVNADPNANPSGDPKPQITGFFSVFAPHLINIFTPAVRVRARGRIRVRVKVCVYAVCYKNLEDPKTLP